jgi:hypothetical protein
MRAVGEPLTCYFFGGAEGIRTPDPLHAMEVRYQLRYSPVNRILWSRWTATAYRLQLAVRTNQPHRTDLACEMPGPAPRHVPTRWGQRRHRHLGTLPTMAPVDLPPFYKGSGNWRRRPGG